MNPITEYTRSNYRDINRNLLKGIVTDQATELIEAVTELPALPGTTFRTFWVDDIAAYAEWLAENRQGKQPLRFDAFTSTSRIQAVAKRFNGNVRLTIQGKNGRDIAAMSDAPTEQETLYLPGLTCQISKVRTFKAAGRVLSVEVELMEL